MLETQVERTAVVEGREDSESPEAFGQSLVGLIDRLGRYVLLDRLGRGAFGTVWAAYDPQLDRRVAIKIVYARHEGGTIEQTRDQLLSEAQILAQLSHPNVVAIHDVGRLEDALGSSASLLLGPSGEEEPEQPTPLVGVFIVMEFLGGATLGEWLRELDEPGSAVHSESVRKSDYRSGTASHSSLGTRGLVRAPSRPRTLTEILRVFCEAGRGLEAAHERGLMHLDFKPGNVMFGDDGRVRVLDFGLARVGRKLDQADVDRSRVVGTPAYMAPEQHLGDPTDARADQFAFCVVLWEAMYGERPYVGEDAKALFQAKHAGPPKLATQRITEPHIHAALLRGLSFEAGARFPTIGALLDAILDDPRARRRRVVTLAGLVVTLVGAGFGLARASGEAGPAKDPCAVSSEQFTDVWDQPRRAAIERAYAQSEVPSASTALTTVVDGLDEAVARWTAARTRVCREALVEGEASVEQMSEELLCLDRQLRSMAGLSQTLAEADAELVARGSEPLATLPSPADCRREADDSTALGDERRRALLGLEDALSRAELMSEIGRLDEAQRAVETALASAEAIDDARDLARGHRQRGVILRGRGQHDAAAEASLEALGWAVAAGDRRLESEALIELLAARTASGEFPAAGAVLEVLTARVDDEAEPDLGRAVAFHAAVLHERQQHWDEALAELDVALALLERDTSARPGDRAEILANLGNIYVGSGRDVERGKAAYVEAIEILAQAYGDYHPSVAKARINLAGVLAREGAYARAIDELEVARDVLEHIHPEGHPYLSKCEHNLGALRTIVGDFAGAIEHTRASLATTSEKLGDDHPDYATAERNLATLLLLRGRFDEALTHREHAADVYAASYEEGDTRRMAVAAELAEIHWWLGEDEEARRHLDLAVEALEQAEPNDLRRITVLSVLALVEHHERAFEDSLGHAQELVKFCELAMGPGFPDLARARVQLAAALGGLGRVDEARAELELAEAALARPEGAHPYMLEVLVERGRVELRAGAAELAVARFEAARALAEAEGVEVFTALVELELAAALADSDPERAASLRAPAEAVLARAGVRVPGS